MPRKGDEIRSLFNSTEKKGGKMKYVRTPFIRQTPCRNFPSFDGEKRKRFFFPSPKVWAPTGTVLQRTGRWIGENSFFWSTLHTGELGILN